LSAEFQRFEDLDALLDRADRATVIRYGQAPDTSCALLPHEIDGLIAELEHGSDLLRKCRIIGIFAYLGPDYKHVLERFLIGPDYTLGEKTPLSSILGERVLMTFFLHWDLFEDYIPEARKFINGVPWDLSQEMRHICIHYAGDYLQGHANPPLLRDIIDYCEKQPSASFRDQMTHAGAMNELRRIIGGDYEAPEDVVLKKAKERLRADEAVGEADLSDA
jgi:hypothetical protein